MVGAKLRDVFRQTEAEPLPDHMVGLISELDERERPNSERDEDGSQGANSPGPRSP
jgi:hypothetical protein